MNYWIRCHPRLKLAMVLMLCASENVFFPGAVYGAETKQGKHTRASGSNTSHNVDKPESLSVSASRTLHEGPEHTLSRAKMDIAVPGTSPLQILSATTPGVSFTSDDPFGLDTWANTLYVRGFNQSQIDATLDGIPMGDQAFQEYNGLDVNEAIIQDNISSMSLSQGGGALDVPSTTTLGGALTYHSSDPDDVMGGTVSQTFGSNTNGYRD